MNPDAVVRRTLATSVVFNLGGALGFAFPQTFGGLAGFPAGGPRIYTATIAMLVTLFAGTYAFLARQRVIDRPLVAFAAIGKAGFFAVVAGCWLAGEVALRGLVAAGGDLVFAAIFAWWLLATR